MATFEAGFGAVETAADRAAQEAATLGKEARKLLKAAQDGEEEPSALEELRSLD